MQYNGTYLAEICDESGSHDYVIDEATYESCEAGTIGLAEIVAAGTEISHHVSFSWENGCDGSGGHSYGPGRRLGDSHQRRRRGRGRAARARP